MTASSLAPGVLVLDLVLAGLRILPDLDIVLVRLGDVTGRRSAFAPTCTGTDFAQVEMVVAEQFRCQIPRSDPLRA